MKLLFITIILISTTNITWACSCANLTAIDLLQNSDTVSLAIAKSDSLEITREMSDEDDWVGRTAALTEFEIINDYKRFNQKKINVISPIDMQTNCGIHFKKDEIVILSTTQHPTTFEMVTSSCSIAHLDNQQAYRLMIELDVLSKK